MKSKNRIKTAFFVTVLLILIGYVFFLEGSLPVNKNNKATKIFVVNQGESITSIIKKLYQADLIRSRLTFHAIVIQRGIEKSIQAGDFRLSPSMSAYKIAEALTHGTLDRWVTIIEGLRKEEIADIIDSNFDIPATEFINLAEEGYLFPDTYLIPKDATADTVISILKNNFNNKFSSEIKQRIAQLGLTEKEGLIIASLVEKEGRTDTDRPIIAGIILNRLDIGMKLDIDATIQYALGYQPEEKTWWKKNLTENDKLINSPYNTYRNAGLPPTPICNPGLSSITAVSNAKTNTSYLYYMHDNKGRAYFAETLEQHISNINRHLR